jgi:ABC-type phosphate transport system ATPase subunit
MPRLPGAIRRNCPLRANQIKVVYTAYTLAELRDALKERGIVLAVAHRKHAAARLFDKTWLDTEWKLTEQQKYSTLTSAVQAFHGRSNQNHAPTSA